MWVTWLCLLAIRYNHIHLLANYASERPTKRVGNKQVGNEKI